MIWKELSRNFDGVSLGKFSNDGKVYLEIKGAVMRCRSNLEFPQNPSLCSRLFLRLSFVDII
jgi:hypothetical protein